MNIFLIMFVGICLLTAGWSFMLVRRAPDWRIGFLEIAVGIMPIDQAVRLLGERGVKFVSVGREWNSVGEFFIGMLWFVAILILQLHVSERKSAELRQRLLEALEGSASWRTASATGEMLQLTSEESKRFLDLVCGHRLEALFTAAVLLGLRCDELLSLQWVHVDFSKGTLTLPSRSSVKPELPPILPLPALCLARLQNHRALQERLRQEAGSRWQETGLVFTSPTGTMLPERKVLREFQKLLTRAGIANSSLVALHMGTAGVQP